MNIHRAKIPALDLLRPEESYAANLPYSLCMERPELTHSPALSIIGGGFCGTVALIHTLRMLTELEHLGNAPDSLRIQWFDSTGNFGRGLPYRLQSEAADNCTLILNQPASLMSPFADQPDAYTKWLSHNHPLYGPDSFTPRSLFGTFLEYLLEEAEQLARKAGCRFEIVRREARVKNLTGAGNLCLEAGGELVEGGPVIVASGHQRRDQFEHLAGQPTYIDEPFEVKRYRSLDLAAVPRVILIGGGPSSIDAIRILESLGYQGNYQIVASRTTQPWPFDPACYSAESYSRFVPKYLRPELLSGAPSYRDLMRLLKREVKTALKDGFGVGHVYHGIDLAGITAKLTSSSDQEGAREFGKHLSFLRGNITAPENIKLLQRLRADKRLCYLKGHAIAEVCSYDDAEKVYSVVVQHPSGNQPIGKAEVLVNCALFPRNTVPLALIQSANTWQASETVFPVGPALGSAGVIPRSWGVESFRNEVEKAARNALRKALEPA